MPQQPANPDSQSIAVQWGKLDPQQRQTAMSRMTPDQKGQLASALGFKNTATVQPNPTPAPRQSSAVDRFFQPNLAREKEDVNTLKGYGSHAIEGIKGIASNVPAALDPRSIPGSQDNPINWNPATQFTKDWQRVKDWNELRKVDPDYAWGSVLGAMLLTHAIGSVAPHLLPASMADKLAAGAGVDPADVEPVASDLRAARALPNPKTGKPAGTPRTVGQFVDLANTAQKALDHQYDQALGKNGFVKSNLPDADGNFPLSERILELRDKYSPETEWGRGARKLIEKRAAEYQKPISLRNLDLERKNANSRIDAFEAASQIKQASRRIASPDIAVDEAVANWVRDNVYPDMDALSGKRLGYFRQLKTRIGNLMRVQSDAELQAEMVRRSGAVSRGTPLIDKLRPGVSMSSKAAPHGWLGNIKEALSPMDREASADKAIGDAFDIHRKLAPSRSTRRIMSRANLPLSALVGGAEGTRNAQVESMIDYMTHGNPTDAWQNAR